MCRHLLPERIAKQARLLFPNALVITERMVCPRPMIPDPRPTMRLMAQVEDDTTPTNTTTAENTTVTTTRWTLLLPMTSRGQEEAVFWNRLENTIWPVCEK